MLTQVLYVHCILGGQLHLAMGRQYQLLLQQREGILNAAVPQEAGHFNIVFFECSYGKDKHVDVTSELLALSTKQGMPPTSKYVGVKSHE
jgi:hypothetical protein